MNFGYYNEGGESKFILYPQAANTIQNCCCPATGTGCDWSFCVKSPYFCPYPDYNDIPWGGPFNPDIEGGGIDPYQDILDPWAGQQTYYFIPPDKINQYTSKEDFGCVWVKEANVNIPVYICGAVYFEWNCVNNTLIENPADYCNNKWRFEAWSVNNNAGNEQLIQRWPGPSENDFFVTTATECEQIKFQVPEGAEGFMIKIFFDIVEPYEGMLLSEDLPNVSTFEGGYYELWAMELACSYTDPDFCDNDVCLLQDDPDLIYYNHQIWVRTDCQAEDLLEN
jgi:hypothetical protein